MEGGIHWAQRVGGMESQWAAHLDCRHESQEPGKILEHCWVGQLVGAAQFVVAAGQVELDGPRIPYIDRFPVKDNPMTA